MRGGHLGPNFFFGLGHVLRNLSNKACNVLLVKSQTSLLKPLIFSEAWYTLYVYYLDSKGDDLTAQIYRLICSFVVNKALIRLWGCAIWSAVLSAHLRLNRRLSRWAYSISQWSAVRLSSTLSNFNTAEARWLVLIKFYMIMNHHWGWGKAALGYGADWIKTLVSMKTKSSHRLIMGNQDA